MNQYTASIDVYPYATISIIAQFSYGKLHIKHWKLLLPYPSVPTHTQMNGLNQNMQLRVPNHAQNINFMTQLVLEIKLTYYLASLWACHYMTDQTLLKCKFVASMDI